MARPDYFLIPDDNVYRRKLGVHYTTLPPPGKEKKPFHVAAFSVFLIGSIFFNGIHPNFSFLFYSVCKKRGCH